MASIQKRGDGWRVFVAKQGVRKSKTFVSKSEALAWASTLEHEIEEGFMVDDTKPKGKTIHQMLDRFYKEECPKRDGGEWEKRRIDKFKKDFKDKRLSFVTSEEISEWRNKRLKDTRRLYGNEVQIKPASVRRDMTLLKTVFDVAVKDWGWLKENPMKEVKRPGNSQPRKRIISPDEQEAMLEAMHYMEGEKPVLLCQNVAIAFLIALETGMRAGEIGKAKVSGRVAKLAKTKNGDARDVPLSTKAVALFKLLQPVTPRKIDTSFRKARAKAGLSGFTFHDSRATACTRLARKVDVLTLAKIIGHRDINSLLVYYRESAESIADRLD